MIEVEQSMYTPIDIKNRGHYTIGWAAFNRGPFKGRTVLFKHIPGEEEKGSFVNYLNSQEFEIPLVALNPLVAELILRVGDPNGEVAQYFLAEQEGKRLICSPTFRKPEEEIIEGVDILKSEHQRLKRTYAGDVLLMAEDLTEALKIRKVPQHEIDRIIRQFIKDCFKYAFMKIIDPNNTNWAILYSGLGKARIAPMYDLDLGLNLRYEYNDKASAEIRADLNSRMAFMQSPHYMEYYISALGSRFKWFESWVKSFANNIKGIDIGELLLNEKGIRAHPKQIEHYEEFITKRVMEIEQYLDQKKQMEI